MPDFVPLRNDVDLYDKPRKLSKSEINAVVQRFPLLENIPRDHAKFIAQQIMKAVKKKLKTVSIAPSKVSRLIELMILGHQRALIAPGHAKGFEVTGAITSNLMQMALDSFKTTGGIADQTTTIPAIERLISASKSRTGTLVSVAFKKINGRRITISEARKLHGSFVSTSIGSLLKTLDVGNAVNLRSVPVPKLMRFNVAQQESWYQMALTLSPLQNQIYSLVLRLQFDTVKLVKHQVTLRKITWMLKMVNGDENLQFVASPHNIGIIDVYAPFAGGCTDRIKLITFFSKLSSATISGIPFVTHYAVNDLTLFSFAAKSKRVPEMDNADNKVWKISLDKVKCGHYGVDIEDFANLFTLLKWQMKYNKQKEEKSANLCIERESKIFVAVPNTFGDEDPGSIIFNITTYQKKILYQQWEKKLVRTPQRSLIIDASSIITANLHIAKKSKSNLRLITDHPLVDFRYTYSNDIHEICAIFGINAARARLIYALNSALNGKVDLRQLNLAADAICNNKKLLGLTFDGASERLGPWSKALFETPAESIVSGAVVSIKEPNEGVFASYTIGDTVKIGTGSVNIAMNTTGAHITNDTFLADDDIEREIEMEEFFNGDGELDPSLSSAARKFNAVPFAKVVQPDRYSSRRRLGNKNFASTIFVKKIIPQTNDFSSKRSEFDFSDNLPPSLQYLYSRRSVAVVSQEINIENYIQMFLSQGANAELKVRFNFTLSKTSTLLRTSNDVSYESILKSGKMPSVPFEKRMVSPAATYEFLSSYS